MDIPLESWLLAATRAQGVRQTERIQSLWRGYGEISRVHLRGASRESVVLKRVEPPAQGAAPGGSPAGRSHARKLRSYTVEAAWYRDWSARCGSACRVPACLAIRGSGTRWHFLLEDLDAAGFGARRTRLSAAAAELCLRWLASFHATFLGASPTRLWEIGTYWHLATRPDELAVMAPGPLKAAAGPIDARLSACAFPTLVHGDAKPANFCFSPDGSAVAAVDFQYVGGGCGMKDVAYLLGALGPERCAAWADALLDRYFACFRAVLADRDPGVDGAAVEASWRALYPLAWADHARFLAGWLQRGRTPGPYEQRMIREALRAL